VTNGNQCRVHAVECFRMALLSSDNTEIALLSVMGCQWTDLAALMDADARAALRLVASDRRSNNGPQ
jgi:hypothetical protein